MFPQSLIMNDTPVVMETSIPEPDESAQFQNIGINDYQPAETYPAAQYGELPETANNLNRLEQSI